MDRRKIAAAELMASGEKNLKDLVPLLWDCRPSKDSDIGDRDERKVQSHMRTLRSWLKEPIFQEYYRGLHRQLGFPLYSKALRLMESQLDSNNPWLAQGAARDILTRLGNQVIGSEEQNVHVVFEGMPELGEPGDEE